MTKRKRDAVVTWQGVMGRWSIFPVFPKTSGVRVQGVLTKEGGREFEKQRRALEQLCLQIMGRAPRRISDADTVEFLARGRSQTRLYLIMQRGLEGKRKQ